VLDHSREDRRILIMFGSIIGHTDGVKDQGFINF
jgi:hypothetical protein